MEALEQAVVEARAATEASAPGVESELRDEHEVERLRARGQQLTPESLAQVAAPYGIEFLGPEPVVIERRNLAE